MYDILCANYNNAAYLEEFFEGILNSTLLPNLIIFVDDCSKDNSLEIAERYRNLLPIKIISLDQNVGFGNALNIGIEFIVSEYVARIDPDDIPHVDRFKEQINYLQSNVDVALVGSQAQYFKTGASRLLLATNMPTERLAIKNAYLKGDNGVLHGTVMLRSMLYQRYKYFQDEVPSEDYGIFSRMSRDGFLFANINKSLTYVRIHGSSVSNDLKFSTVRKIFEIRRKIHSIPYLDALIYLEFLSLKYYRAYLFSESRMKAFYCLSLAAIFSPRRAVKRLFSKII